MTFALQLLLLCSICYQSISTEQPLQSEEMVKAQVNSVADISGQPTFDSHTPVVISPESDESLSDELLGRITEHPQSVPPNGNNFVFQRDPYLHNNRPEQAVGNSPFNDQLQPHPQSHVSHDQWVRQPSPHRIIQERQPLERMPDPLQLGPPVPHAPLFNTFMNPSHYTPGREQMSRFQPENLQASDEFVSLTIIVHPAVKQCLYYSPATDFVIEYQVIRGGHLDIGLYIRDPDGKPVSMRHPSSDASIAIKVPPYYIFKPYAICLDNRKATYAEKYVALSVDLDIDWENPSAHELAAMEYLRKRSLHNPDLAENTEYVEAWKSLLMNGSIGADDEGRWKIAAEAAEKFSALYYSAFDKPGRPNISCFFTDNVILLWNGNRIEGREGVLEFLNKLPKSSSSLHSLSAQPVHKNVSEDRLRVLVNVFGTVKFEQHPGRQFSETFILTQEGEVWCVQSLTFRFID